MVKIIKSGRRGTLLVGSDLVHLTAARREVAAWARSRGIVVPHRPIRLSIAEDGMVMREYTVFDTSADPGPRRPESRFATSPGEIPVQGKRAAA